MNKKLNILITLLLLLTLINTVSAETVNIDYTAPLSYGDFEIIAKSTVLMSDNENFYLKFNNIESWRNIYSIVGRYDITNELQMEVRDSDIITDVINVEYKIGSDVLSTGIMQGTIYKNSEGLLKDCVIGFTFDTPLNIQSYNGAQTILVSYTAADFNLYPNRPRNYDLSVHTDDAPYLGCWYAGAHRAFAGESRAYKYSQFHQSFVYEYYDESEIGLNLEYDRKGFINQININGSGDFYYYDEITDTDISLTNMMDLPITINVSNPVYISPGIGEWFNYTLPVEYVPPEGDKYSDLTYTVYNAEIPTQIISTTYNLTLYNSTSKIYEPYKTGFNSGTMTINVLNNQFYNMSLTKTGFTSKDDLISVFYAGYGGPVNLVTYMYPDYGVDNYSVMLKVRDYSTGDFLEGVKVIGNSETKYTPYNGDVSFTVLAGVIEYEVSKPNYVSISGNATITENQAIYIYMMTVEEAINTTVPTPTPTPPDLEQPTNLLESIKYAFAQMFGLTESADLETINLFMGLGIIFAGAVLIASITKDALGAVVGALIGFVMSLALGFIPLWVLFVGFASFAIYIILTKTGGGE